jgi:hypothetical protein
MNLVDAYFEQDRIRVIARKFSLKNRSIVVTTDVEAETGPLNDRQFGIMLKIMACPDRDRVINGEILPDLGVPAEDVRAVLGAIRDIRLETRDGKGHADQEVASRISVNTAFTLEQVLAIVRFIRSGRALDAETAAYMFNRTSEEAASVLSRLRECYGVTERNGYYESQEVRQ